VEQFDIKEGARQGDPLACLLFNKSSEKVIRDSEVETIVLYCIPVASIFVGA
jgi:hypothetical protein